VREVRSRDERRDEILPRMRRKTRRVVKRFPAN
jgi:hypothetical protein